MISAETLAPAPGGLDPTGFRHPGLLQDAGSIARMRRLALVPGTEEARGLARLAAGRDRFGLLHRDRVPAAAVVYRAVHWSGPGEARDLIDDGRAAYANALLFAITRDPAHAAAARRVVDAWSSTMTTIARADGTPANLALDGRQDYQLYSSYSWPAMLWAAELLRSDPEAGWPEARQQDFLRLVRDVVAPVVLDADNSITNNWGSWKVCFMITWAVYSDDTELFARALREHAAQLDAYVKEDLRGEMGRDLWHSQMGLIPLVLAAEVAWNQGVDLVSQRDFRVHRALEYQVPFFLGDYVDWPASLGVPKPATQHDGTTLWRGYVLAHQQVARRFGRAAPRLERMLAASTIDGPVVPEEFHRVGYSSVTHRSEEWSWVALSGFDLNRSLAADGFTGTGSPAVESQGTASPLNGVLRLPSGSTARRDLPAGARRTVAFDWRAQPGAALEVDLGGVLVQRLVAPAGGRGADRFQRVAGELPAGEGAPLVLRATGGTAWLDNLRVGSAGPRDLVLAHWLEDRLPAGAAGAGGADPDGDGRPNLREFAEGTDPARPDPGPPSPRPVLAGDGSVRVAPPPVRVGSGVRLRARASADLRAWQELPADPATGEAVLPSGDSRRFVGWEYLP